MTREEIVWLRQAQSIAKLGNWDQDPVTGELWWSDQTYLLFNLDPQKEKMTFEKFLQMVHPDDRNLIIDRTELALKSDDHPYKMEYKITCPDNDERIVYEEARINRNDMGEPIRIIGIIQDITSSKRAEDLRERNLARQQAINKLQGYLLGAWELKKKLKSITDTVIDIFDADFCRIWIIRPGDLCDAGCMHIESANPDMCTDRERCLHLVASSGRYTHIDGGHHRVPFGCYKIGRIASDRHSKLLSSNVTEDPQIHDHEWASNLGLKSFAGYQLQDDQEETVGVLALFSKNDIGPDEDLLLESLGHSTAQVIQTSMAQSRIKILSGFLPICASCKNIRDDKGNWNQMEAYIRERSEAEFSHGICPDCTQKLYPFMTDKNGD